MEVKITHLDQATFAIHSPSHSILCDQLAELRWERKKSEYKKSGPDRPTKLIFIVLLRSEFRPFGPGSLAVPWTIRILLLADKSFSMNSLCDCLLMHILPQDTPGNRLTDPFLLCQGHGVWARKLRLRFSVLGTDGFQLVHLSMRNHFDSFPYGR